MLSVTRSGHKHSCLCDHFTTSELSPLTAANSLRETSKVFICRKYLLPIMDINNQSQCVLVQLRITFTYITKSSKFAKIQGKLILNHTWTTATYTYKKIQLLKAVLHWLF